MSDSMLLSPRKVKRSLARRIGLIAMVGLIVAGSVASLDAEARRMGGGRSIGRQSNTVQQQAAPQPSPTNPAMQQRAQPAPAPTPAPAAQPNRSRWLGPIAGLAAGLGIAALLSHFGLGGAFAGAMANIIVIALLAMIGIWLIRRFLGRKRDTSQPAYAGHSPSLNSGATGYTQEPQEPRYTAPPAGSYLEPQGNPLTTPSVNATPSVPAGFDSEPSCATRRCISCDCKPHGTSAISTTFASSPRRKCSPRFASTCLRAAPERIRRMSCS